MIVVDVETTGIYSKENSIVSIGAVDFLNPKNQFYEECKIWEGAEITDEALGVNGFTREEITNPDKQSLEDVVKKFINWTEGIEDKTLAGENPSFDRDFLMESAKRYGVEWPLGHRTIDLHSLSYENHLRRGLVLPMKNNRTDLNSNKTLVYVGLPEEPNPHNALTGAKMEAEAFSRLIYGKNLLEEYNGFEIPDYFKK